MTTPSEELAQQQRWILKPGFATLRVFDELLENEFRSESEQQASLSRAVRDVVRFAAAQTPYYAGVFARLGVPADAIEGPEDLTKLPILQKDDLIESNQELVSRRLPPGDTVLGPSTSSGTTGRPVTVLHTYRSSMMYGILGQRSARWFKLDPLHSRLDVRPHSNVYHTPQDTANPGEAVLRRPSWHALGEYFQTGPQFAFNSTNPIERQVAWLQELGPNYVMTLPSVMAEWLLASEGQVPGDNLEALIGVAAQMPPSLRTYLERNYRVPIHQVYGLNEIGPVAIRCTVGRYHVNVEHCLAEIVSEDGHPCAAGETGRLLVTGFRNFAMPLIRYDTGDLAEAVASRCPCGRTLPSFGEIAGRQRFMVGLPEGTRERVRTIRSAIENCSASELAFLRTYQIHQDRENRFTLRMQTVAPIPDAFAQSVLRAWERIRDVPPAPLVIIRVDEIPMPPHGKRLDLISEFHRDSSLPPELQDVSQPRPGN